MYAVVVFHTYKVYQIWSA